MWKKVQRGGFNGRFFVRQGLMNSLERETAKRNFGIQGKGSDKRGMSLS